MPEISEIELRQMRDALRRAAAHDAALAAGVKPDRAASFVRGLDLTPVGVDLTGRVDDNAMRERIADALTELPEFRAAPAAAWREPGSGAQHLGARPAADTTASLEQRVAAVAAHFPANPGAPVFLPPSQ